MANTLKSRKGNSSANDFQKMLEAFSQTTAGGGEKKSYKDERIWTVEGDKAGNGSAVIRFLPRTEGDELPWVRVWSHSFKGPGGKWYIENCPTTIGLECPTCELNNTLWNSGIETDKEIVRTQKRRLAYITNIVVLSDPKHPENEGKVFLFKFGKKIFDMIKDKAQPTFEDEAPINVFDPQSGADFKFRMVRKDGYANYDKSEFASQSPLEDADGYTKKQYPLAPFIDPKEFKPFDELKKRLVFVIGGKSTTEDNEELPVTSAKPIKTKEAKTPGKTATAAVPVENGDEDTLSYFQKLADDDE